MLRTSVVVLCLACCPIASSILSNLTYAEQLHQAYTSELPNSGTFNQLPIWNDVDRPIDERVAALLSELSTEEKLRLVRGRGFRSGSRGYVGSTLGIPRLGIPALHLEDGPQGVADRVQGVTAWPSALSVAASWDGRLMREWGKAMAEEHKSKGVNVMLGPMVNIARLPTGGRNFESFGEDPHLTAMMAFEYVRGVQQTGVVACVKHAFNNNQEQNRQTVSSKVGARAQWELYFPAFEAAIEAGVGSAMCSYNKINGTYACENPQTLTQDLKSRMGFQGWVMSDWFATHSTTKAALAGLDQEMPNDVFFGSALEAALEEGTVPRERLDDMSRRILRSLMSVGLLDGQETAARRDLDRPVTSAEHNKLARKLAAAGTVLLKNEDSLLPLPRSFKRIAVIGDDAHRRPQVTGGGSGAVSPPFIITPLEALKAVAEQVGGSISYTPTKPLSLWGRHAAEAEFAIVFVSTGSTEGSDRPNLSLDSPQDAMVEAVLRKQPNTIVVAHTPGSTLMPWAPNVSAILAGFMPGQEDGAAIVDVLFGTVNPSGRLPVSFPRREEDTWLSTAEQYPGVELEATYSEELLVGYRWHDSQDVEPLFPFGHGLSYTSFKYSNLKIRPEHHSNSLTLTLDVYNEGLRTGHEVVQLYLSFPPEAGEPPRVLRGFHRIYLGTRARRGVVFTLSERDFSIWDISRDGWRIVEGLFQILIGASSRDIRLVTDYDTSRLTAAWR